MDFGIFGITPEQIQEFRTHMENQRAQQWGRAAGAGAGDAAGGASATSGIANGQQQQGSSMQGDNPGGSNGDARDNQQEQPVFMHNAAHNGVVCDICEMEIHGFRYKCMQCPDFDLCSKCEHKGHHAGHIMMRISFPEQARDAIRKYLSNVNSSCPPSPPSNGPHHGPRHGPPGGPFGSFGPEGFPFRRLSHCHRRGRGGGHGPHGSPDAESAERPATAPGCPYDMGKKEFKKWAKWMKKAAAHQHRSAEAYARAAASSGNAAGPSATAGAGAEADLGSPVDFSAVASQIQEFLNYWGVPVDVVELYDQFGNRGQPTTAPSEQSTAQCSTGEQNESSAPTGQANTTAPANVTVDTQTQQPGSAAGATSSNTQEQQPGNTTAASLTENLKQMRIAETQNNASAPRDESLLMDLEAENSGWTILGNSREQSPLNSATPAEIGSQPPAADASQQQGSGASSSTTESLLSNNGNTSTPFASVGSNASNGQTAPSPSAPRYPSFPNGVPNVPMYPVLNTPQIQQILQGVSSAVNSVVRTIPIVTDPRGPVATNTTNATPAQVPSTGADVPELDARSMKTLNQLLAMGFSNEEGYLTRLVIAKNGDLEAVLSSLFPN